MADIERVWNDNLQVYGADKVWQQLKREGITVARCTVERLMRRLACAAPCAARSCVPRCPIRRRLARLDRVNRQFKAERPNQLWVSDFTYVSTWQGWVYVASLSKVLPFCL